MADDDLRDTRVVIYMTRADADKLAELSRQMKFKSRSTFVVALLERFIMGGFSVASFFKVGSQIQKRMEQTMPDQMEFSFAAIREGLRPFPALPPEDDPSPKEVKAALKEIREELQTATK